MKWVRKRVQRLPEVMCNIIFDVKIDFSRKAQMIANGRLLRNPQA